MWSNQYISVPFEEKGRTKDGADCWGLVMLIYADLLGIELPSCLDYSNTKDKLSVSSVIKDESAKNWQRIEIGQEQEFDIPVFRLSGVPMHVGVVIKPGTMIHCERGCGTYHTEYNKEKQWINRLEGFYRYAKSTDLPASLQT